MEENIEKEKESENLNPEEIRRRRLAYFQSLGSPTKPITIKQEDKIPNKEIQFNNQSSVRNIHVISEKKFEKPSSVQNERKQEQLRGESDHRQVPHLTQGTSKESHSHNEEGYDEEVERLINTTKKEMAEKYSLRKSDEHTDEKPNTRSSAWNSPKIVPNQVQNNNTHDFRNLRPQPANDLHVEDIFSERNNSSRPKQNMTTGTSMRDSHDIDAHAMFQKSVDYNEVEELGLSTHRPGEEHNKEMHSGRSPRALDQSMSEELKYALGEKKYQEFLEKSMKDIDALYGDNMKNKKRGDKLNSTKDINIRRDHYEKVTNSLMGQKPTEIDGKLQNELGRSTDRFKRDDNQSDGHRPLLNRPKHEPVSLYQNKRDTEEGRDPLNRSKSTEEPHILSSRNFAFSADEIYSQAYQPNIQSVPVSMSAVNGLGHGHPTQVPPGDGSVVGHSHMSPREFHPHPGFYHSHSHDGSPGQHFYPGEYFMPQSPPGYFVPHPYGSPGSRPHSQSHGHPPSRTPRMMPQSPNQRGDNSMNSYPYMSQHTHYDDSPGRQMSARHIHSMDPQERYRFRQQHPQMFPHPPEEHSFDPEMIPHPPSSSHSKNTPHHFHQMMTRNPHIADQTNQRPGPQGDMTAFQDYLHLMPKGIPYPPPPNDVELQAYFQYLGSKGYPIPYQTVMPPVSPKEDQGLMIPHPPANKKEGRPVSSHFRRRGSHDKTPRDSSQPKDLKDEHVKRQTEEKTEEVHSSQRHIEGIRQKHEQRRQQQENEMLEKQRIFAKESIDRYFVSLQHHSSKHSSNQDISDKPMEILRESLTDVQTLVNSDVTGVTLNAGGITDRMDELGIDLSYLKTTENENSELKYKSKGENPKTRTVIVCPECGEINKPYMTWCSECSEVLIGIEPIKVKPKRKGTKVKKNGESSDKNYVIYKNVTFDDSKNLKTEDNVNDNEKETHETARSSKSSPTKSEGRDSGRPSSEENDINRTEHEIDEICQSLSDPVIKGFIKAYFNKKRQEMVKTNCNENDENSVESDKDSNLDKDVKVNKFQKETKEIAHDENHHSFRHVDQHAVSKLKNKKVEHHYVNDSEQFEKPSSHPIDEVENPSFIHPIDNIENPIQLHQEYNHEHLENEEVWLHEQRRLRMDAPMSKKHLPIDIEVFTLEESRQGKMSQRDALVPSLNLANSSDEDETGLKPGRKPFIPLSMSAESDDLTDFFAADKNFMLPSDEPIPESPIVMEDEESKPFLARLLDQHPKMSKRPPSASTKTRKSNPNVKSVVKESIDAPLRQRKWAKSSTAWGSYNSRELSTKSRPSSAGNKRPSSGTSKSGTSSQFSGLVKNKPRRSGSLHDLSIQLDNDTPGRTPTQNARPVVGAELSARSDDSDIPANYIEVKKPVTAVPEKDSDLYLPIRKPEPTLPVRKQEPVKKKDSPKSLPYVIDHRLPAEEIEPLKDLGKVQHAYTVYQEMTPRIQQGKFSAWLCLPDEIMLQIFSFLSHSDLINTALVCKQYYRVALDETLWRYITVKKNHDMDDEALLQIGHRHPVSLALIQCHGDNITAKGLREIFKECSETLRELNFCGCCRGALTGDCILLHASARCHNLTHIDASWCMVTDSGIGAISSSCKRLESLCINGCQNITDEGLETVIKKHGANLRVLEMFGCFKITPKGMRYLATHCINLRTLNLGQCYKLKDSCISQLSSSLGRIECLDLRGVKHIKDNCIRYVVKNCPRLKTIVLANCPNISDVALLEISTYLSDIRVIDVCGCRNITDNSIRALSNNCQNLRNIDISSTGCTHRSVSMLANFCSQRLEVAKLNFLADVTDHVVVKLVKHCKRLKILHLYGCTSVKDMSKLQELNPDLKVEM